MRTAKKALLQSQSGASLLEFALVLPLLLLLLLGVIEIGRYAYVGILVGNAARAGAAYGAQTAITAADTAGITNAASSDFNFQGATLAVTEGYACACDTNGVIGQYSYYQGGACPIPPGTCQRTVVALQVTACTSTTSPEQPCGTLSRVFPGRFPNMTISRTATMRIGECPTCPQ
jgi:Flp pilus assembly protein TadG